MNKKKISLLDGEFCILRFPARTKVPGVIMESLKFWSVTSNNDELSILCETGLANQVAAEKSDLSWKGIKLEGPFDFDETGVLSSLLKPLAEAEVGIFALSTFDTDYLFVKSANFNKAQQLLKDSGYEL